jgi:hypothetical protein
VVWQKLSVNKSVPACDDSGFSPTLYAGLGAVNWVVCRSVGGYPYLSRRDGVVGVQVDGSRGRFRTIKLNWMLGR